jgi:hypothetical protein
MELNKNIYSNMVLRMMSSTERTNDPLNLTTDKSNYEATAGTMKDGKINEIKSIKVKSITSQK